MQSGGLSILRTTGWGTSTPPEVLLQVLRHFAPGAPQYNTKCVDRDYIQRRSYFAHLRLVCKAWDGPVSYLLFRTTVLFMRGSDEDTRRNLVVLDHHPNLIQSLAIVAKRGGGKGVDIARIGFEKKIGGKLGFCSKLRELILIEGDFAFMDRRWVQKTCLGLASTVTSLKLVSVTKKTCSLALAGFSNLTSLEVSVRITRYGPEHGPIHIPSTMPRLSHLTLKDHSNPPYDKQSLINKIFSRLVNKDEAKNPKSKQMSPLRYLSLDAWLDAPMITTILTTNNIGLGLTSFAYLYPFLKPSEVLPLLVPALKLCPRLEDFSFGSPCHGDVFRCLPHSIRRLTFVVGVGYHLQPDDPPSPNPIGPFEIYSKSQAHSLEYVHVHIRPYINRFQDISGDVGAWTSRLEDTGIPHTLHVHNNLLYLEQ